VPVLPVDRRALLTGTLAAAAALATGCSRTGATVAGSAPAPPAPPATPAPARSAPRATPSPAVRPASAAQVARRASVPVLCWHQLRDWRAGDSAYSRRLLICPPRRFRAQLDALGEAGFHTIGPDRYLEHLTTGAALPDRPVLLSFDDSQGSQITEGLPQLRHRDMTATFFCMTVVLDKAGWMSRRDLRRLDDAGMTVAAHTYDHHRADRYSGGDWALQLEQPRALLEKAVGHPVEHFAYPYGAWAQEDVPHLRAAGYRTAFQLGDQPLDRAAPLYTLRRTLVDSTWDGPQLLRALARPV